MHSGDFYLGEVTSIFYSVGFQRERGQGDREAGGGGAHCHCWSLGSRSCFLVHGEMTTGTEKLHVPGKVSVIEVCGCRHKVTCLGLF